MRRQRRRRRAIGLTCTLALLVGGPYAYFTRPARLSVALDAYVRKAGLRLVQVEHISFTPWAGLRLMNLELAPRRRPADEEDSLRLLARDVSARCDYLALLTGRLRAADVRLRGPIVTLVRAPSDGSLHWRMPEPRDPLGSLPPLAELPRLTVERADVQVRSPARDGARLLRRWIIDADGGPQRDAGGRTSYVLRARQVGGSAAGRCDQTDTLLEMCWLEQQVRVRTGWVGLDLVLDGVPPEVARLAALPLGAGGYACVREAVFGAHGLAAARIELQDVRLSLPLEDAPGLAAEQRFLQLRSASGELQLAIPQPGPRAPADLTLTLSGRLNEAPARVTLKASQLLVDPDPDGRLGQANGHGPPAVTAAGFDAQIEVDRIELPTARTHPAFVASPRLPNPVREAFRQYQPRGPVRLRLHVWKNAPGAVVDAPGGDRGLHAADIRGQGPTGREVRGSQQAAQASEHEAQASVSVATASDRRSALPVLDDGVRFEGVVEAHGAACRYYEFPYDFDDVRGTLRFSNDGTRLEGMSARHGDGLVRAEGRLNNYHSWTGFELRFSAQNVALDDDLYTALPPAYQNFWREAAPRGVCDATTIITRREGSPETGPLAPQINVDVRLLSGSANLGPDRRLRDADGRVHIEQGLLTLDGLRGWLGQARVRLDGTVELRTDDAAQRDVQFVADDVPFEHACAVRDARGQALGMLRLSGVGDARGRVTAADGCNVDEYAVEIKSGALRAFGDGPAWENVRGCVVQEGDSLRIESLEAQRGGGGWLHLRGVAPRDGAAGPLSLDIEVQDAALESLLPHVLPARWSAVRDGLRPSGPAALAARLHGESADAIQADLRVSLTAMQPTALPLLLRDVSAELSLRAQGFAIRDAVARCGPPGALQLSGRGGWSAGAGGDQLWAELSADASGLELTDEFIRAMPEPLARLLERIAARGRVGLQLERIRLAGSPPQEWDFQGRLDVADGAADLGLPLAHAAGELEGVCRIRPAGVELDARLRLERGELARRPIEAWSGALRVDPSDGVLGIEDARGRLCDGDALGQLRYDPKTGEYELALYLHGVDFDRFFARQSSDSDHWRGARLEGQLFLRGRGGDPRTRTGGGELRITGGSLLSSRITAGVLEATRSRSRAVREQVERAELRFAWQGHVLQFTRVDLYTPDLRLIGVGEWDLRDDRVSLTLLGAHPQDAPRLAVVSDLVELAGRELLQYRVEGTVGDPRVSAEPLHRMTAQVRQLLAGEAAR